MQSGIKKLIRFLDHPECQDFLGLGMESYFGEFAEAHDFSDVDAITEAVGADTFDMVYPCALEFFFSNDYIKNRHIVQEPWNVIDLFLRLRGSLLSLKERDYLRALRQSHMSVYEIVEIVPDHSLILRDMIEEKPPVRVFERSLTRFVGQWEVLGARICSENGRLVLAGGCLKLSRKEIEPTITLIRNLHNTGMQIIRQTPDISAEELAYHERMQRVLWAKEIGNAYLESTYAQLNRKVVFKNSDGDDLQFCTMTFPLNADWLEITELLAAMPDLDFEENTRTRKFWNWYTQANRDLGAMAREQKSDAQDNVQIIETQLNSPRLNEVMRNLGTIELRKTILVAQANSRERTTKLEQKLQAILGDRIGAPLWEYEKMPDGKPRKTKKSAAARKPSPKTSPVPDGMTTEERDEAVHAMIRGHYEAFLQQKNRDLGDLSPVEACRTEAGRKKVTAMLKEIECTQREMERKNGMSAMDMAWMWPQVGLAREAV